MTDGYTLAHLLPRDTPHQRVLRAEVTVEPGADEQIEHVDIFGNRVVRLGVHRPHDVLEVTARCAVVATSPADALASADPTLAWDAVVEALSAARGQVALDVAAYQAPTRGDAAAGRSCASSPQPSSCRDDRSSTRSASSRTRSTPGSRSIRRSATSRPRSTRCSRARRGVCQDFAHLGLACLRSVGLAARYVSGYIETVPPPGEPKVIGADASHAWCSVWAPGLRLDRPRPDQRPGPAVAPRHRRVGTRLLRRRAGAWRRHRAERDPVAHRRRRRHPDRLGRVGPVSRSGRSCSRVQSVSGTETGCAR